MNRLLLLCLLSITLLISESQASTNTWDERHSIDNIEVTLVYYLPNDRQPIGDWRRRIDYYARRLELFHHREFQGQSKLKTIVREEPLISEKSTAELRDGDGDFTFFQTLRETDRRLEFAKEKGETFPILLVMSDMNWRPLDDFYRVKPDGEGFAFEGNYNDGQHFPGAESGGARATYLSREGKGWGLVSADGWRVPYRGSDCVVYHEGCGHTVGLPHPEPGNGSVMSLGQYKGWISESWLDNDQKARLGWEPGEAVKDPDTQLFSKFRAIPEPMIPRPGEEISLKLDWPEDVTVTKLIVEYQTSLYGPWIAAPAINLEGLESPPDSAPLPKFQTATPVSYRVTVETEAGATTELWGYFQVRERRRDFPTPPPESPDLAPARTAVADDPLAEVTFGEAIDLLKLADPEKCWTAGEWTIKDGRLQSPKGYGARLELPYAPPAEGYRMVVIAEPLDSPNALNLGQVAGKNRFLALINYAAGNAGPQSALENVNGENVGNSTTFTGPLLAEGRMSQIVVTVHPEIVTVSVDGQEIIRSLGGADRYSLSDYWKTPGEDRLFLGAYDCRYRFHRVTLHPVVEEDQTGDAKVAAAE
ncbi:MAG: hypothetical protein WD045_13035 [Pirellulaceae bacterium]